MNTLRFETWNKKRQIVVRNEKGQLVSRTQQKGSGIRTKQKALERFKEKGTLSRKFAVVSKRKASVTNQSQTKIKTANNKTVTINQKTQSVSLIGKNTAYIKSTKPIKSQQYYQYIARVRWGDTKTETIGYSDMKNESNSKESLMIQAFQRAKKGAEDLRLLNYDDLIEMQSQTKGFVVSQDQQRLTYFEVQYEVGTYVQTAKGVETA